MSIGYPCKHCGIFLPEAKRANCTCEVCRKKISKERYLRDKLSGKIAAYKDANKDKISEYNTQYQRENSGADKKRQRKLDMCEYKGNKCTSCFREVTYLNAAAFDFHHIDESTKLHDPSDMVMMKWERVTEELDKCVLICSNCHRILHADIQHSVEGWDDF